MIRRLALLIGLAIAVCGSAARAEEDPNDEVLKRFFPTRDLCKSAFKFVNVAKRCYGVADTIDILDDGRVRVTNVVVIWEINAPNQPARYSSVTGTRMLLKFERPIKELADLTGNAIVGCEAAR